MRNTLFSGKSFSASPYKKVDEWRVTAGDLDTKQNVPAMQLKGEGL